MITLLAALGPSTDYFKMVTDVLDTFVNTHVGLLVPMGLRWLTGLLVIQMAWDIAWHYLLGPGGEFDPRVLAPLIIRWCVGYTMLLYYVTPIPWLGVPTYLIIPKEMNYILSLIDRSTVDILTDNLRIMFTTMEVPGSLNVLGTMIYGGSAAIISFIWFLSFGVTVIGYIIVGVGNMLGPLAIPFIICPTASWIFRGALRFTLIYSSWRVFAAAFTLVWGGAINVFLDWAFGYDKTLGNYTLGHMMFITPILSILCMGFAGCILMVSAVARDFFSGSSSISGAAPVAMVMAAARAGVAALTKT